MIATIKKYFADKKADKEEILRLNSEFTDAQKKIIDAVVRKYWWLWPSELFVMFFMPWKFNKENAERNIRFYNEGLNHGYQQANGVCVANEIASDSWLNEGKYSSFKNAYEYAMFQTFAISTLSKITPEELYITMHIILRKINSDPMIIAESQDIDLDKIEEDSSLHAAMSGNLNDTY